MRSFRLRRLSPVATFGIGSVHRVSMARSPSSSIAVGSGFLQNMFVILLVKRALRKTLAGKVSPLLRMEFLRECRLP